MKIINRLYKSLIGLMLSSILLLSSCVSYLDQSPDAGIAEKDLFKNFKNFQGFIEGVQAMIVNPFRCSQASIPCLADEGYLPQTYPGILLSFDAGDYNSWQFASGTYFGRIATGSLNADPTDWSNKGVWSSSWYGIYTANYGLANIDTSPALTKQERDVLKGQLLFLRAYFYFDIMQFWGGMPYIKEKLSPSEVEYLPRLNYRETTRLAAQDFADAAELLPLNWDEMPYGQLTITNNRQRLNKVMALAMQAKCLLYAGSPLMNYESTGNKEYDADLCKEASILFKQVIELSPSIGIKMQDWDKIGDVFYTTGSRKLPGGTEMILAPLYQNPNTVIRAYFPYLYQPSGNPYGSVYHLSINYAYTKNFGMANGLPINDPASGYDSSDPWSGRDPRFDKWVLKDGDKVTNAVQPNPRDQYAELYKGGAHRTGSVNLNLTGIDSKKYWNTTCNYKDNASIDAQFMFSPPTVRLADVYLMYAESVLWGYGTPKSSIPGDSSPLTPEDAVNIVRDRASVGRIASKFTTDRDVFFEQLVIERAVELFLEGQRFTDLRRWLRNGDARYITKTALDYDRGSNGKPINISAERVLTTRVVQERHNWLPLPLSSTTIYPTFKQNPGW